MAQASPSVVIVGLREGATHADKMGTYTLVPDKVIARRAVWQADGGTNRFIYYAPAFEQWFISDRTDMEAGATSGWLYVNSTELTPHLISAGVWQVAQAKEKETQAGQFDDVVECKCKCKITVIEVIEA